MSWLKEIVVHRPWYIIHRIVVRQTTDDRVTKDSLTHLTFITSSRGSVISSIA